jgi:nucleoside-diphosphate-sugar epimerase
MSGENVDLKGKHALVTGASGLVGRHVTRRLAEEGMDVRALVRRATDLATGVTLSFGDIRDRAAVTEAVSGAGLVVHCAAVLRSATRDEAMAVNVEGTRLLLQAAREAGCERFIHISTTSVHDIEGRDVVDETTPLVERDGADAYGGSKAAAEQAVWAAAADGLPVTVLRPPAILGVHPACYWTVRLPRQIAAGEFSLQGDGRYSLAYVHVINLADAIVLTARSDRAVGQAYLVIDGHTTWRDLTDHFLRWLDLPAVPSVPPETVPAVYRWHGRWSGEKLRRELGYVPRVTFERALAEAKQHLVATGVV